MDSETQISSAPTAEARKKARSLVFLILAIAAVLFLALYHYPLLRTYQSWNSQHGYNSNGLIIFLGGCYLFFAARKKMHAAKKNLNYFGLLFLGFGLLCTLGLKRADFNAAQTVFCLFSFWSALFYLCGWQAAKEAIFPLIIMLFSVQWGLGSSIISTHLRILSTDLACRFINFTGKPWNIEVIRQGTNVSLVHIPEVQFDVAAPCSGLQSLIMTSVLCLIMAYLFLVTFWKRVVMLLLIAPIAVLNNSLRIVLIAYCGSFFTYLEHTLKLSEGWGRSVAFGAFHEYPGVVVYTLGFIMIFLASSILERLPGKEREIAAQKKRAKEEAKARKERGETENQETEIREDMDQGEASPYYLKLVKPSLAVLALVILALVLSKYVKANIKYTPGIAYATIPYMVTGEGLYVKPLPIITNIPTVTATRVGVPMPISDLELKELPSDTAYFRAMYFPKDLYAGYEKILSQLFNSESDNEKRFQSFQELPSKKPFDALSASNLVLQAESWRSNLTSRAKSAKSPQDQLGYLQNVKVLQLYALAQIAQLHRAPESVLLAIVQNDKDHHSIHAPEACFPSQGWSIDEPVDFPVTLGDNSFDAARMDVSFLQADLRETIIYWYQCDHSLHGGSPPVYATRRYMWLPFKTTFDLVFRGLGDRWAFVRLSNPVTNDETYEEGAKRIQDFLKEIEAYLIYKK